MMGIRTILSATRIDIINQIRLCLRKNFIYRCILNSIISHAKINLMLNPYRRRVKKWLASAKKRRTYATRQRRMKVISIILAAGLFFLLVGVVGAFGTVVYFSKDLPSPDRLSTREVPQTTKIYSRDGVLLYEIFGDERRTLVELHDIPEYLKQATVAVEDKNFYNHGGFDLRGFIRAAWVTLRGEGVQGGSTISQQVIKNTLLTPERTLTRKIKELMLSIELERKYSKDEILQMYFNEVPYGGQAWGVGAAAEMYFGKSVSDLTLAEATLIAGLPQAPSYYSPCGAYPENAALRQGMVLNLMVENGYVTEEDAQQVKDTNLKIVCLGYDQGDIKAPHFVMYVKQLLTDMFGEKMVGQGGLRVITTLDWGKQQIAEEEARKQVERIKSANVSNAGVIVAEPSTGQIMAMVGSIDYFDAAHDGNVNVILAERQPGSSIKPITYLTAFTMGYTPSTFVSDIRTCFPGGAGQPDYCPNNWDDKYWGPMAVRDALANSRNVPAVKMLQVVGIQNMINMSHKLGITTLNEPDRYGLSLTLGGGEVRPIDMAQVFSVLANMGKKADLTPLLKVEDPKSNVLHEYREIKESVIDERSAFLINNILSDSSVRKRTFGNSLEIGRTLAVKTGTTNDNRDAWTIGYTPQFVSVVWVGNFNNDAMIGIQGSTGATPIMKGVMSRILEGLPEGKWVAPEGIVTKTVDSVSGLIPQDGRGFPTKTEVFAKGTEPTQVDDFHVIATVCKSDPNRLATDFHKQKGQSEDRTFTFLHELSNDWQSYTDEWMTAHASDGYGRPPVEKCPITVDGQPIVGPYIQVTTPLNNAVVQLKQFDVKTEIFTLDRITKVEFIWDDAVVATVNSAPYQMVYNLSELSAKYQTNGNHTLVVRAYDSLGEVSTVNITVTLAVAGPINTPQPTTVATPIPTPTPTKPASGGPNVVPSLEESPTPTPVKSSSAKGLPVRF